MIEGYVNRSHAKIYENTGEMFEVIFQAKQAPDRKNKSKLELKQERLTFHLLKTASAYLYYFGSYLSLKFGKRTQTSVFSILFQRAISNIIKHGNLVVELDLYTSSQFGILPTSPIFPVFTFPLCKISEKDISHINTGRKLFL